MGGKKSKFRKFPPTITVGIVIACTFWVVIDFTDPLINCVLGKVVASMMVPSEWKDVPPATTEQDLYMQEEPKHIYFAAFFK